MNDGLAIRATGLVERYAVRHAKVVRYAPTASGTNLVTHGVAVGCSGEWSVLLPVNADVVAATSMAALVATRTDVP